MTDTTQIFRDIEDTIGFINRGMKRIQEIVHTPTAGKMPAHHHFQKDFDEIRAICEAIVGPYQREASRGQTLDHS